MTLDEAHACIQRVLPYQSGAFYGAAPDSGVGAGMIYENVRFPAYDPSTRRFATVRGVTYVLTHECDVEQSNDRPFKDSVLICPIIELADLVAVQEHLGDFRAFITNVASRNVPRVAYLPTVGPCTYGGFLYLNKVTFTSVSEFLQSDVRCVGAVSATGLREMDAAIQNLLLREKSDLLWGVRT